jgi:2-(1,2-epoxy-1,2-dihydrophenyl)acetyl-CoA isomerase
VADPVLLAVDDGVATLVLNRPEKLNAFAGDMRDRMVDALDALAAREDVRALVITGAGRAFCAGGDVSHMAALKERDASFEELRPLLDRGRDVIARLAALPFPTLAAVNGPAAGAGLNLALACDVRVADERATFGATFVRIGLHPDWGGTWFLPRRVGLGEALLMAWTGDLIDAREALRIGLVERLAAPDRALDDALALARRLAVAPRASVHAAKRTLRASAHRTLEECLAAESAAQAACWASPDVAEGLRAFAEKRTPVFGRTAPDPDAPPSMAARQFE